MRYAHTTAEGMNTHVTCLIQTLINELIKIWNCSYYEASGEFICITLFTVNLRTIYNQCYQMFRYGKWHKSSVHNA